MPSSYSPRVHTRRLVLLGVLLVLALAACGSESGSDDDGADGDAGGSGGVSESTGSRPGPAVEVTVTFWPEGKDGASQEATLTCEPTAGTHPNPEEACQTLLGNLDALAPVAPDMACTMIFGGPEQATVVGVVNGEQVDAEFNRSNGCELDRWDRMATVLQLGD
jgi:subtilisin inhibitor-like